MLQRNDEYWMAMALAEAMAAEKENEVPVGAVLVDGDTLLAKGGNGPIRLCDPSAHAEILALRQAASLRRNYRLPGTTLYVTLEPCIMCMGAIIQARIARLVYGASDPKAGAVTSVYTIASDGRLNHHLAITGGILAEQCGGLLSAFFKNRRQSRFLSAQG